MSYYRAHKYADIVPEMTDEEFKELKADIEESGLLEDIILLEDKILDGRHRYKACKELGIKARFINFSELDIKESPLDYVLSKNLKRRHLTSSQKAAIAVDAEDVMEKLKQEAKEREKKAGQVGGQSKVKGSQKIDNPSKGRTNNKLAKTFDTNRQYISDIKKIKEEDPKAHKDIKNGKETIPEYNRKKRKQKREKEIKEQDQKEVDQSKYNPKIAQTDYDSFLGEVENKSFDLLVTDPPYMTDVDNVEQFANNWVNKALSKIKDSGQAYICTGAYPAEVETYLKILNHHDRFDLTDILVWTYRNTLGPQPKDKYHLNWQAIFYLRGPDAPEIHSKKMKEKFAVQDINAPDGRQGDRFHKWQKPNELAERFIRHSSKEDDKVLDPFAGTGTFLIAAAKYNRDAVGCDIDSEILETAQERGCEVK